METKIKINETKRWDKRYKKIKATNYKPICHVRIAILI